MNTAIAKQIGGRKTFRRSLAFILAWQLFLLLIETRGDFANGFIFYLASQLNIFVLLFYILILTAAFLFGRMAGEEILNSPHNYIKTGIKYALITSLILIGYWFTVGVFQGGGVEHTLHALPKTVAIVIVVLLLIWLWSVRHIKQEIDYRKKDPSK
ncbi:hypothetical protein [Chitinophaga niabensis]|uniref:Uncharacterized protein n=1 Tax=Chitinophaga niabensis TaxID=536979 RepID=A0A1N6GJV9_9BACT|nr:hypothetical protein [Chitinophaga niabensis]SIO07794.1 hypothetical protein SAMN04488055_2816 [Chitinophaga niabensis]